MSVTNTPISGSGSNAEPIIPSEGLDTEESLPLEPGSEQITPADGDEPAPKPGEGQPDTTDGKEDGRVIPQWMRALKEANPQAYQKAKTDLFDLRDRRSVHPTVQAAREEHDLVQSLGGKEGVSSLREDVNVFKTAAQQFLKGDPGFVADLWDEDPIAAALHVQPMLDTFFQKDREGWNALTARMWDKEFQAVGFGSGLKAVLDAVKAGNKDESMKALDGIIGWYNSILDYSKKAEDPRVKTLLAERAKTRDNESNTRQAEFMKSYRTEATQTVVDEGAKVFDSFFKGRKIDAEDRTDLLREAFSIANRAVEADKAFMEQRNKHLELGDRHSALQLTKSRYAREMSDAVKRVARRYGLVSGTAQPNTAKPNQQQAPGAKIEAGWVAVNARPQPEDIDRSRTTNEMIISKRAVLKDGKKVDWRNLKVA